MWFPRTEAAGNAVLWPITFASKSFTSMENHYNNIEQETLGILDGLEKIHHSCFAYEVSIVKDHKLLVAVFKKEVVSLS